MACTPDLRRLSNALQRSHEHEFRDAAEAFHLLKELTFAPRSIKREMADECPLSLAAHRGVWNSLQMERGTKSRSFTMHIDYILLVTCGHHLIANMTHQSLWLISALAACSACMTAVRPFAAAMYIGHRPSLQHHGSHVTLLTYRVVIKVHFKMMPLIYMIIQQMLTNCVSLHPPWLQSMCSLQQADLLALPKTMENFGS